MRTPSLPRSLALLLAAGFTASSCQVLIGVAGFDAQGTGGGSTGSSSSTGGKASSSSTGSTSAGGTSGSSTSSTGSGGQGGQGDQGGSSPGCKTAADCGVALDCTTRDCVDGACIVHDDAPGTACGGHCINAAAVGVGTCDGGGLCSTKPMSCPNNYGCDAAGKQCATTCDGADGCASGYLCLVGPHKCVACGTTPPKGPCPVPGMTCDMCDAATDACVTTCTTAGKCAKDIVLTANAHPARLECGDQCDGISVTCSGASPCDVVCGGGCKGLKLICSGDGACSLTCTGAGCVGAAVTCGGNACSASCTGTPVAVTQTCGNACSCNKTGCL